jgi:hypothetical protein
MSAQRSNKNSRRPPFSPARAGGDASLPPRGLAAMPAWTRDRSGDLRRSAAPWHPLPMLAAHSSPERSQSYAAQVVGEVVADTSDGE